MALAGKVALPGDDLSWLAGVSMTNEDPAYPASNLLLADPAMVAKSTTSSTTITCVTSSTRIVAAALINSNATSATINGITIPIPSVEADGQRLHGWLDRQVVPVGPTDTWTVVLSRPSGVVWVGRIPLIATLYDLNWRAGLRTGVRRPGTVVLVTRLGSKLKIDATIRTRWVESTMDLGADAPIYRGLERSAKGEMLPFLVVPDADQNDAWWVDWPEAFSERRLDPFTEIPIRFEELSGGPPNG